MNEPYDVTDWNHSSTKSVFDNPYWNQIGGGIMAGLSVAPAEGRFEIDPYAGLKGAASGFATAGPVGAIAGGLVGEIGTQARINRNLDDLNPSFQGFQTGGNNQPFLNTAGFQQQNQTLGELGQGQSRLRNSINPVTHAVNGIMGTGKRMREVRADIKRNIRAEQGRFNDANTNWQRQQLAKRAYQDQLMNVYGIPLNYY